MRLTVAMCAGVVLGLNRDLKDKPAGVRTHGLVALGSALVVLVSVQFGYGAAGEADGNPVTRSIQGIIAGIGFLGAGVIIKVTNRAVVRGLTTAATIWLAACLGIAAGAGLIALTALAMGLTLMLLAIGGPLERLTRRVLPTRGEPPDRRGEPPDRRAVPRRESDRESDCESDRESGRESTAVAEEGYTALDDASPGGGATPGVS